MLKKNYPIHVDKMLIISVIFFAFQTMEHQVENFVSGRKLPVLLQSLSKTRRHMIKFVYFRGDEKFPSKRIESNFWNFS